MFRSIAVTTDFSEASREAFGPAASLARKFDARLHVLHASQSPQIVTPWQIPQTPAELEMRRADAQRRLEDIVRLEPDFAGIRVEPRALLGDSAEAIADFQESEKVDLIVIATHGHSQIKHFLLGSFTAKILQLVACPVLVAKSLPETVGGAKQPFNPSRILVPYDFSRHSRAALETAKLCARAYDASIQLLFVVETRVSPGLDPEQPGRSVAEYYEKRSAEAEQKLEEVVKTELKGIPAKHTVRIGHPAAEILKENEQLRAKLIVMGSRGLSVLDRIAMGSVAERTIQGASCPVLATRGVTA